MENVGSLIMQTQDFNTGLALLIGYVLLVCILSCFAK